MKQNLKKYVDKFNADDKEYTKTLIGNDVCYDWLLENIPLIDIPDKDIEETYYFRYWTFRKHIRDTIDGTVITEFLVPVSWGSTHDTIVAAIDFQVSDGKWLKIAPEVIENHIELFLNEKSDPYRYSTPIVNTIFNYCLYKGDFGFGIKNLDLMVNYYNKVEDARLMPCGLFCGKDDDDAMEFTVSGSSIGLNLQKGYRTTLNSYMAANALAISKFAEMANRDDIKELFFEKYLKLKDKINEILWDGTFYKSIHGEELLENPSISKLPKEQNVRELMGYTPWIYCLAPDGYEKGFEELRDPEGFHTEYGLTTAEQRHPRYLFYHPHECLWNGYIWPFATSLALKAMLSLMDNYKQNTITKDDFYNILRIYAKNHYRVTEEGKRVCWIDEVLSPVDGTWSSREVLKNMGWPEKLGGFERGKDYNHSGFCDFVLSGLLGINISGDKITVVPKIPDNWEHFKVTNLTAQDGTYTVIYDKDGTHYGEGEGIIIKKERKL